MQVTDLPHMVRLLGWGEQPKLGFRIDGLTLETRRSRLASNLQAKGRKLEMPQHHGVIATTRQTIWAMDLVEALEESSEVKVGFVGLNQKSAVWSQCQLQHACNPLLKLGILHPKLEYGGEEHILPPDIMDLGYDISAEKNCLFCAEGIEWGQGCVYPMCGEDEFGSIKLDKHLPVTPFQQRKVTRIVCTHS